MNSITETCVVNVSKDVVFDFLSNVENLPLWSTKFVRRLIKEEDKYKAQTPIGEVFIRIDSDKKSGLIDIYAGPTEQNMTPAYMRVIPITKDTTAIMFTFFQYTSTSDEIWKIFCQWIKIEMGNIREHFSK